MHGFSLESGDELRVGLDGVDVESGVFDTVPTESLIGSGKVRAGENDAFDIVEVFGFGGGVGGVIGVVSDA